MSGPGATGWGADRLHYLVARRFTNSSFDRGAMAGAMLLPRSRHPEQIISCDLEINSSPAAPKNGSRRRRAAVKGFKSAVNEGETEEAAKKIKQDKDADFDSSEVSREGDIKVPPKTKA